MFNFSDNEWIAIGLQLWLVFMVIFFVLGYSATLSICLGAVGGFAGGFISAYIKGKNQSPPPDTTNTNQDSPLKRAQNRFVRRWQRDEGGDQKQSGSSRGSLLGRKRRRSISSRRR